SFESLGICRFGRLIRAGIGEGLMFNCNGLTRRYVLQGSAALSCLAMMCGPADAQAAHSVRNVEAYLNAVGCVRQGRWARQGRGRPTSRSEGAGGNAEIGACRNAGDCSVAEGISQERRRKGI